MRLVSAQLKPPPKRVQESTRQINLARAGFGKVPGFTHFYLHTSLKKAKKLFRRRGTVLKSAHNCCCLHCWCFLVMKSEHPFQTLEAVSRVHMKSRFHVGHAEDAVL